MTTVCNVELGLELDARFFRDIDRLRLDLIVRNSYRLQSLTVHLRGLKQYRNCNGEKLLYPEVWRCWC